MSRSENFTDKTFVVVDPDARIRKANNLMESERFTAADTLPPGEQVGNFKRIPKGTRVRVDQVKVVPTGSQSRIVLAHALAADDGREIGWTSSRNCAGKFVNVTLGEKPPPSGTNRFGPNAAWSRGNFLKQITLVEIVDKGLELERIALDTLEPYLAMVDAAAQGGVEVAINSGFRSFQQQKILHDGFVRGLPGFNRAAPPGRSNHQNGIAFDISVPAGIDDPAYIWLTKNAPARGFVRTVSGEPWHWEFDPAKAAAAVRKNTFKTSNVTN